MSHRPKRVRAIDPAPHGHWVGDGFPVQSLFTYDRTGADEVSPFLMLDYAAPRTFPPAERPRGVGAHPHKGFETVTLVLAGELAHRDSSGAGGTIGAGDVQWMTAGDGIVHDEFHSEAFTRTGGEMSMVQLWVNLPAAKKGVPAGYQSLSGADIPTVELAGGGGSLRVVAGTVGGAEGPAETHSSVIVAHGKLTDGAEAVVDVPDGYTTMVAVLGGGVRTDEGERAGVGLVRFEREGDAVELRADGDLEFVLLAGAPLGEPVVGYGPFVMNTREEIVEAVRRYS